MAFDNYINKKCQNCGALRGVGHENECDSCGGNVWVFLCGKHQMFSLASDSCILCEKEISYASQEKEWLSNQKLIERVKNPYKGFLIVGIILGSALMYLVGYSGLYESKKYKDNSQTLVLTDSQLENVNTEIEANSKLLTFSKDEYNKLDREKNRLNKNLNRYRKEAVEAEEQKLLIDEEIPLLESAIRRQKADYNVLFNSVVTLRKSIAERENGSVERQASLVDNRIYKYEEVDIKPVPVVKVEPDRPKRKLFSPNSGTVSVSVVINKNGEILRSQLLESTHKRFNKPVFEALKKWKFSPGELKENKVIVEMKLSFNFSAR